MTVELAGVHHVGIPVLNLENSLTFYREVFGLSPVFRDHFEGPGLSTVVQVEDPSIDAAYVLVGNTLLELLEYRRPIGEPFELRNCDAGAIHVGLEVKDISQAYREMTEMGIEFSAPPGLIEVGPLAGHRSCYFRGPDGVQFEFFQRPE